MVAAVTACGLATVLALAAPPASANSAVDVAAVIAGKPVAKSSDRHPVSLSAHPTDIAVHLTNNSASPIEARTVQLSGTVIGLTFFSYETSVRISVPAGSSTDLRFTLDLGALGGQVTGLIPGKLSVLDSHRHSLASQALVVKINGSSHSVYSIFELLLFILTALAVGELLLALSRQRLPANRWTRGVRFLLPGVGVGLVLVIGASILGVLAPKGSRALPIIIIAAVAMFVAGYLTPAQADDEGYLDEDDEGEPAPSGSTTPRPGGSPFGG